MICSRNLVGVVLGLATGAALFAATLPATGRSPSGPATPDTLANMLRHAKGGQTIVLSAGDYGKVTFPPITFKPALIVEADAARFSGIVLSQVSGVEIRGGTVVGPGGRSYAVSIQKAFDIRVANMRIGGAHRGVVVDQSSNIELVGNRLSGLLSDGINIAYSRHVLVERNSCSDFKPTPAVYDGFGKRLRDGDHADCIQAWSRPQFPPTSDLTIIENKVDGLMQGIFLGNHVRDGVDDGGFDRIAVRGNKVRVGVPNGIVLIGVRQAEVVDNIVQTTSGATLPNHPSRPVRAKLLIQGTYVKACGNTVESLPNSPGTARCK